MMNKQPTPEMEIAVLALMPSDDQLYFCRELKLAARYAYNMMCLRKLLPLDDNINNKALETFKVLKRLKETNPPVDIPYLDELLHYISYDYPEL